MIKWLKSAVCFLIISYAIPVFAAQFPPIPVPFQYVNDYTKTLSAKEIAFLEQKLVNYSKETSSQIAVVIIPSTDEYEISQYAFELGDKWGIGRKALNNGVLMLIAKQDRNIFIAVGQGLESILPDAFLSQLIRQQITPHFKQDNYVEGISQGLDLLIAASKGEFDPHLIEDDDWEKYIPLFMVVIFILFVLLSDRRTVVYAGDRSNTLGRRSSHYRGGSLGGGFRSSGSGGGFGGGSFGGGGAGGSW